VVFYSKSAKTGEADCIDYGLTVFRREVVLRYRETALPLDLARIQSDLVSAKDLGAYEVKDRFYEIGKPDGLAELDALLSGFGRSQTREVAAGRQGEDVRDKESYFR
ncbi:MAG: hypothetical protein WCP86_08965, partial [bacterium]